MPEHSSSSRLLEPALPGGWLAQHRRIWQMKLLNANDLVQFSRDRGLSHFDEKDIIKLWQLGLLKADLVESDDEFTYGGLVDRGISRYGRHVYSDERQLHPHFEAWGDAVKTLKPLQEDVKLLFHPFRYYVLHHLDESLALNIARMLAFNQEGYHGFFDFCISLLNHWLDSEQFVPSINKWNDTVSLVILTEPCTYLTIFHTIKYSPFEVSNRQAGANEIYQHILDYWNNVNEPYHEIGLERIEEIRRELGWATRVLDSNREVHTLLCLGESKLRLELKDRLGGALLLRTMAEMLRRAAEEAFDTTLQEEDELGYGLRSKSIKENLYGSSRLLDDQRAAGVFARWHGLKFKPRIHWYCEGYTEYGALTSVFKGMGITVTNLHGLIKEGKKMVTFFSDSLNSDIKEQVYSIVIIDRDVPDNVRILESAAKNNQISEDDGIFGAFFLSDPDFEFANFEKEELEEILWKWVGGEIPSQADRELLHNHVKAATGSTEFFNGVKRAALSLPQLTGYDKGEKWGEELMKFAQEHPFKQSLKRQINEAIDLAIYWENTTYLERYEIAKKTYMVNPHTGRFVKRSF